MLTVEWGKSLDVMRHAPKHEGHALAQGALALELELEICFPDVIDGRNR